MLCIMFRSWGTVGSTLMNATSSRAHTVQIIEFKARHCQQIWLEISNTGQWREFPAYFVHFVLTVFCWSWCSRRWPMALLPFPWSTWQLDRTETAAEWKVLRPGNRWKSWLSIMINGCHVSWELLTCLALFKRFEVDLAGSEKAVPLLFYVFFETKVVDGRTW